jgi:hypothetical protein
MIDGRVEGVVMEAVLVRSRLPFLCFAVHTGLRLCK